VFLAIGFGRGLFFFSKENCNAIVDVPKTFDCGSTHSGPLNADINYGGQVRRRISRNIFQDDLVAS
jgi:hypothetical protein